MNSIFQNVYDLAFFFNSSIGIFLFVVLYIIIVLLILPASWLSLFAGYIYGSFFGSIIVFIAAFIGASLAFFISKSFFSSLLQKIIDRFPQLMLLEEIVHKGGFKLNILTRLSPIFPFSILNYFYGLNKVEFKDFAFGLLGIIPGTFLYCSLGSLANSLQDLKNIHSTNNLFLTSLGIISTLLVVYYSAKYAQEFINGAN